MTTQRAEPYRITFGGWASKAGDNFGAFQWGNLRIICAPTDEEWQHVSVSKPNKCPTWEEMCLVKDLFWDEDEVVFQFHPAKKDYVNNHPYCLHLWRKQGTEIETPPTILVGLK